ncbi:DUF2203 domain-containing protein [Sporichthya polymorpha]|uniref:DUF2203 domain-containing protein n=1 Tax=Sporichthya polymorpha TaxID=35751 RepID=UPI0003762AB5|nr:DUF2203 domain-containing protein [Sporichthya polymorpha]
MASLPLFSITEAREVLLELHPTLQRFIELRADAAELGASIRGHSIGGAMELRDLNAQLEGLMRTVQETGVQVKGWAPLLMDFPADLDGEHVLLCWLEGDLGLAWYHRPDAGFAGRRPLRFDA